MKRKMERRAWEKGGERERRESEKETGWGDDRWIESYETTMERWRKVWSAGEGRIISRQGGESRSPRPVLLDRVWTSSGLSWSKTPEPVQCLVCVTPDLSP